MTDQNLLVIISDEHQARALGAAGHFVQTPHFDRFAAEGTRFTSAYTPCPICVPARAAFATGRHVHETGCWDNAMPYYGQMPSWGHALQGANVPVESIGKLHYRNAEDDHGFDQTHIPMMVAGGHGMVWGSLRREDERLSPPSRMLGDYIGPGTSKYTDYDAAVTARACDWLGAKTKEDQPWCLYVGLVAPHFPLVVPDAFYDLYKDQDFEDLKSPEGFEQHPWVARQNAQFDSESNFQSDAERQDAFRSYYGLVSWLDHNFGQIMGALSAAGLAENTTVIYSSDHGDNVGQRGLLGKSNFYEESAAVPLIAKGPDFPVGTCETPVSLLDISASIVRHFDVEFDMTEDAKPLQEIVRAAPDPDRPILSQYHAAGAVSGGYMLRRGRWKLIYYVGFSPELFDLEIDPEEMQNRADDPDYAGNLAEMLEALRARLDPEEIDAKAFAAQDAMIAGYGGREAALKMGALGATPPPAVETAR